MRSLKTTECLGLYARDEAFTVSSKDTGAVVVLLQKNKECLNLY